MADIDIDVPSEPITISEADPTLSVSLAVTTPQESAKASESVTIVRSIVVTTPTQSVKLTLPTPTIVTERLGIVDATLPMFDVDVITLHGAGTEASNELPMFEATVTALYGASGTADNDLFKYYSVASTGSAFENPTGTADNQLPQFLCDSYGYSGSVGTADIVFPMFSLTGTGIASEVDGVVSLVLPLFVVDAYGEIGQAVSQDDRMAMYAMNMQLMGVTEYASMNAVGLAFHQGKLYMANSNGIWACDAEGDDGEAIPVLLFRENIDFGSSQVKALTDAYSYVRSTGGHSVRVTARDSGGTGSTTDVHANPHGSKVQLPRGLRSRVFDVLLYAAGDNELEVNEIELLAEVSHVRRGRQNA